MSRNDHEALAWSYLPAGLLKQSASVPGRSPSCAPCRPRRSPTIPVVTQFVTHHADDSPVCRFRATVLGGVVVICGLGCSSGMCAWLRRRPSSLLQALLHQRERSVVDLDLTLGVARSGRAPVWSGPYRHWPLASTPVRASLRRPQTEVRRSFIHPFGYVGSRAGSYRLSWSGDGAYTT
jgi:hypothetical protein